MSIKDLRDVARKRLPKAIFDYIEGGCDDEHGLQTNEEAFSAIRFIPRCMVDVAQRDQSRTVFGYRFNSMFGIAPTGLIGLFRYQGDKEIIQAAARANIPFILSGAGTASFKDVQQLWPQSWVQLYVPKEEQIWRQKLVSAEKAGFRTLVVTADVPAHAKRERNARRGWSLSASAAPSLSMMLDAMGCPRWTYQFVRHGFPFLEAWRDFAGEKASSREVAEFFAAHCPAPQNWRLFAEIRRAWQGKIVVKGVLSPEDARISLESGADAVLVSNHGARQLDHAVSTIEMLPSIVDVIGGQIPVFIDSGIIRGSDIVAARALGADMAFVGRATLYGLVAGGLEGALRAITILSQEVDLCMAQLGLNSLANVPREVISARSLQPRA